MADFSDTEKAILKKYWINLLGEYSADSLLDEETEEVKPKKVKNKKNPHKKKVAKKKPPEPIRSRYEILDL